MTCLDYRVHRHHEVRARRRTVRRRRASRERLRLQAAERFARDEPSMTIARDLRISVRSVQRWKGTGKPEGPERCARTG
ncbi:helix-turn-helix domain-containing protein [Streptosporangium sp. NPDC000239]|uniref:helix-turn-helix domain-containing protein n=1 Tax=Streptosporangium sp. NPDC000239 TaxID=3154248 RepID=UPI00331C9848